MKNLVGIHLTPLRLKSRGFQQEVQLWVHRKETSFQFLSVRVREVQPCHPAFTPTECNITNCWRCKSHCLKLHAMGLQGWSFRIPDLCQWS